MLAIQVKKKSHKPEIKRRTRCCYNSHVQETDAAPAGKHQHSIMKNNVNALTTNSENSIKDYSSTESEPDYLINQR